MRFKVMEEEAKKSASLEDEMRDTRHRVQDHRQEQHNTADQRRSRIKNEAIQQKLHSMMSSY